MTVLGFTRISRTFPTAEALYRLATDTRMENRNGKTSETRRPAWFRNLFSFRFFTEEDRKISDKAIIDPAAEIAEDVEIGPFCVIGPNVRIDAGCILHNNVTVSGNTSIGRDNIFFPNSVIGTAPQDKKFKGAATRLVIGSGNAFREACTVHVGTEKGGGLTRIDDDNLFMVNSHIGHDCLIGSHCVVANNVMIAGHVVVGDYVVMNGGVGINQFVSIGEYAYLTGYSRIHHDVPPFCKIDGSDEIRALNKVGMARSGMGAADIAAIDEVFRKLFLKKKPLLTAMREYEGVEGLNANVVHLLDFLKRRNQGKHGRFLETHRHKLTESMLAADATVHPAEVVANPSLAAPPIDAIPVKAPPEDGAVQQPTPSTETAPA